jgi:nickel-dependent lactate racemase
MTTSLREFELPYGKGTVGITIPDRVPGLTVTEIAPAAAPAAADPRGLVAEAVDTPVGCISWDDFSDRRSVAIAVNDKTRPVPHEILLPPLLERLHRAGFRREDIVLLVATGTHPPMQEAEFADIMPAEIARDYRVVSHNGYDPALVQKVGTTSLGTPVLVNRRFLEADLRIVVGNIEPHQFMGFSGGVKSAVIGLAGHETIDHNHAFMREAGARLGNLDHNPTRDDVEQMGRMVRVDFALNAILNRHKELVDAVAGRPGEVMRAGVERARSIFEVDVSTAADVVIASSGGHPKDINLYQAQKTLAHASLVAKPGAPIVLLAACGDGTGSEKYESWVRECRSHDEVLSRFAAEGFRVGPHKAFQISRDAAGRRVILVSEMEAERVRRLLLEPAATAQEAVDRILADLGTARAGTDTAPEARPAGAGGEPRTVALMPVANATVPRIRETAAGDSPAPGDLQGPDGDSPASGGLQGPGGDSPASGGLQGPDGDSPASTDGPQGPA